MKTKIKTDKALQFLSQWNAGQSQGGRERLLILQNQLSELIDASESAMDWLCESYCGSDQRDRGERLRKALRKLGI